jgi:hypothetical protein
MAIKSETTADGGGIAGRTMCGKNGFASEFSCGHYQVLPFFKTDSEGHRDELARTNGTYK